MVDNKKKDIHRIKAVISFSIALIILSGIVTNVFTFNINGYTINALSTINSSSSLQSSSPSNTLQNDSGSNVNTNNNAITNASKQYQQQLSSVPRTHEYTLIAENTTLEIAPGLRVDAWTYNGTIPGPTITATEGDRVIIHFINKTPLPHTVHLHGDHPSEQDGVFELVGANKTYTYDFIAQPAGALAYHCHVPPVMQHVRMGLYGAFIVYPKTPLPPAREYVFVDGEYDTQNQLNPLPEYYMFNGYTEQYMLHPPPAKTNETVRIYLINMGMSPAYGMHIHGTLFKAYPSGILENPPLKVQSWELASGNTAILEAKWPWPGKFTFHFHGIPEERGAMGYFNVTDAPANAVDGKDIAITKNINMNDWQMNLTKTLQKADPYGNVTAATAKSSSSGMSEPNHENNDNQMKGHDMEQNSSTPSSTLSSSLNSSSSNNEKEISIVKGATTLNDKAYSPNPLKIKVGSTITWINKDNTIHTVSSGKPNSPDAGQLFDSGLTSLIMPSKSFSHKFTNPGEFSYFCKLHPNMVGTIEVEQ
ncbi:MAG: multicopper oxidase domain-containing protein [Candidatus Nitrosocosmicus sp.]